jgi:hypothetical protein
MTTDKHGREALIELDDVAVEFGQSAIEAITSEDIFAHLPVFKGILAAVKTVASIRDRLLTKKIETLLRRLADIPREDRLDMIRQLEEDPTHTETVGEHLVELLDRLEGQRKAAIAGDAFAAFARKEIDRKMLRRLLTAVDRLPAMEIDIVRRFVNSTNNQPERDLIDHESIQALIGAGFATSYTPSTIGGSRTIYQASLTCQKFVELDLDLKSKPVRQ